MNETFKQEIKTNIHRYIADARRNGTVGMTIDNLLQCVLTPRTPCPGTNARYYYAQAFREICEASHSSFILRP